MFPGKIYDDDGADSVFKNVPLSIWVLMNLPDDAELF